jgi:tetratricopeptide (TPR) repeat protein
VYTAWISLLIGALVGGVYTLVDLYTPVVLWKGWAMGLVLFFLISAISFIVISRIIGKRVEPLFLGAQKQVQAGAHQGAINTLEQLLPMARWQVMLKGQIHAQIGCLHYSLGDEKRALEHLEQSSRRVADARLFLAALYYRRKEVDKAVKCLDEAIGYNKKQILLYNTLAWIQLKEGKRDEAIAMLLKGGKADDKSEATQDNIARIQNGKRMNMKRFGMSWYALQLEKPPASMRQQQPGMPRRGYRQKRKGGKR